MPCKSDEALAYTLYGWMTFLNTCSEITLISWIPSFRNKKQYQFKIYEEIVFHVPGK